MHIWIIVLYDEQSMPQPIYVVLYVCIVNTIKPGLLGKSILLVKTLFYSVSLNLRR